MKTTDEEIEALTNQFKEWGVQLATLAAIQEEATISATKLAQQAHELSTKHLAAAKQIRELELHKSGFYMWENIGCGG